MIQPLFRKNSNIFLVFPSTRAIYSALPRALQDRPLKEAVKDLNLSIEKEKIVFGILDSSAMETLGHYSVSSEQEKQILPGFIRKHFDELIFASKKAFVLELFEKDELEGSVKQIYDSAPLFVSKGIYTLDAWKALSLQEKQAAFGSIYKLIDAAIMKKSKIYQELQELDSSIPEDSLFVSKGIYTLDAWKALSLQEKQIAFGSIYKLIDAAIMKKSKIYQELQELDSSIPEDSLFVSKGIYTLDAWKTLPLQEKQIAFGSFYKQIDIAIVTKTEFYKQLGSFLDSSKRLILLNHASWLLEIEVYKLLKWFEVSEENFVKIMSFGMPKELTIIYVVQNIAIERASPKSIAELLAIERQEQGLQFDDLISRSEEVKKINGFVSANEDAFIHKSQVHQHWGLIAIYGASGVGKTRLAHSIVDMYQKQHKNRAVFDVYAKQSNGVKLSNFSSVTEYVKYLLVVALFAKHFNFSNAAASRKYIKLLNSNAIDYVAFINAARLFQNLNDRFDVFIRIDEYQLLFHKNPEERKESSSYTLAHELLYACTVFARGNVHLIPIICGTWTFDAIGAKSPFPTSSFNFYATPIGFLNIPDAMNLITRSVSTKVLELVKQEYLLNILHLFGAFGRLIATLVNTLNSYTPSIYSTSESLIKLIVAAIFDYFRYSYINNVLTPELFLLIIQKVNINSLSKQKQAMVHQNLVAGAVMLQNSYLSASFGTFLCFLDSAQLLEHYQEQLINWVTKPTWIFFEHMIPLIYILKYQLLCESGQTSCGVKEFFDGKSPTNLQDLKIILKGNISIQKSQHFAELTPNDLLSFREKYSTPCYVHIGQSCSTCDGVFLFQNCTVLMQYKLRTTKSSDVPAIKHTSFLTDNVADKATATKFIADRSFIRCQYNGLYSTLINEPNLFYCFVSNAKLNTKDINFTDGTAKIRVENRDLEVKAQIVDSRSIILDSLQDKYSFLGVPKRI